MRGIFTWLFWGVFLGFAAICVWAFFKPTKETPTDPWNCSECGNRETHFTRQCGACEAYRVIPLRTEHLVLREWRDEDLEPFAALNADPRVMEFLPKTLDRAESDSLAEHIRLGFATHGFGLWAVEVPGVAPFIGFIGLSASKVPAPCVAVECRLAFDHWGLGYATEGAMAALEFGFQKAKLDEIVALTVPANVRSIRVLEKLGMTRDRADDFDHPNHRLRRHVLYRLERS